MTETKNITRDNVIAGQGSQYLETVLMQNDEVRLTCCVNLRHDVMKYRVYKADYGFRQFKNLDSALEEVTPHFKQYLE